MTRRRVKRSRVAMSLLSGAVALVGLLAYRQAKATSDPPAGPQPDEAGLQAKCLSQVKQLALAQLMYAQDHDERFPPADRWCDVTYPYIKSWELHHCPADTAEFGYAMNHKLSRLELGYVYDPARTILLYESETGRKNECDQSGRPGDSLPDPPRHRGGSSFGFVDGHAKWLGPDAVDFDMYRITKEQPPAGPQTMAGETK